MRVLLNIAAFYVGALLMGCVAQSVPSERYYQSESMSAPLSTVSVADPNNFSFSIVGDLHIEGAGVRTWEHILDQSIAGGDAFGIVLGDLVDKGDEGDFLAYKASIASKGWTGKVFPVLGNHDVFYNGWQHFANHIGPSHYTFQVGNSKFVVFDTADGIVGKEQMDWLEARLGESRPENLFLCSHYMPFIPGINSYLKLASQEEANLIMKWTKKYNVTAWMGAHYHSYLLTHVKGSQYVVAGGGGGRRMDPIRENFYVRVTVAGSNVSFTLNTL